MKCDTDKPVWELFFVTTAQSIYGQPLRRTWHEYWSSYVQPSLALVQANFDWVAATGALRGQVCDLQVVPVHPSLASDRKIIVEV